MKGISALHSGKRQKEPCWNQSTINANCQRRTGIFNRQLYVGRQVWNRYDWVRHPDMRERLARLRDGFQHMATEVPSLRIVPQDLWLAVEAR